MERERMEIALRVITATSQHRKAAPEDAAGLWQLAESDDERTMPLDELACVVIMRERRRMEDKLFGAQFIKRHRAGA